MLSLRDLSPAAPQPDVPPCRWMGSDIFDGGDGGVIDAGLQSLPVAAHEDGSTAQ